jgi:hypothetical protein
MSSSFFQLLLQFASLHVWLDQAAFLENLLLI